MMVAGISDWGMLVATGEWGTLDAALSSPSWPEAISERKREVP